MVAEFTVTTYPVDVAQWVVIVLNTIGNGVLIYMIVSRKKEDKD